MYTVILYQNWIRNLFISIIYSIGPPSKLYEDNHGTITKVLADRIAPQTIPLDILITSLHKL